MITSQQILDKSKKAGIPITKRTFEYYQRLGFLPKPHHKVKGEKGRGVYGYYEPIVIDIVKKIYKLKNAGHSLNEIKEISKNEVLEKYRKILIKWGLSGRWDKGSVLLDSAIISEPELQILRKRLKKKGVKDTSMYTEKGIAESLDESKRHFERYTLETVRWWHTDEEIEYEVVENIIAEAYGAITGIKLVQQKLQGSKEIVKAIDAFAETQKIHAKALSRKIELDEIFAKKSKKKA